MTCPSPTVALPSGFTALGEQVRAQLGDSLLALLMFGSCLSATTRQPDSVPDLLAFVADLDTAVRRLGGGWFARRLAGWLPPLTLALRDPHEAGRPLAKLNLIELPVAQKTVRELPDLYLTGRLSKPTAWLWYRDEECRATIAALLQEAATAVAELTLRGLKSAAPVDREAVVLFYIGQSYLAEVRPEGQEKWRALRASFPAFYDQRVSALLLTSAPQLGLRPLATTPEARLSPSEEAPPVPECLTFLDERTPARRRADHRAWAKLMRRSRWRTVARWPKMALVYRGWLAYLLGKLRRVWRQRRTARQPGE